MKKVEGDGPSVTESYMQVGEIFASLQLILKGDFSKEMKCVTDAETRGVEKASELVQHGRRHVWLQQRH